MIVFRTCENTCLMTVIKSCQLLHLVWTMIFQRLIFWSVLCQRPDCCLGFVRTFPAQNEATSESNLKRKEVPLLFFSPEKHWQEWGNSILFGWNWTLPMGGEKVRKRIFIMESRAFLTSCNSIHEWVDKKMCQVSYCKTVLCIVISRLIRKNGVAWEGNNDTWHCLE